MAWKNPARRLVVVALAVASVGGAACAKAPPRTRPEPPAATVPALPPAPLPLPATVLDVPPAELPAVPPSVPVAERIAASAAAERPAEPPARRPEAPPEPPKPEQPPQQDPPRLGTPETANIEVATRQVGESLDRARASLGRVRSDRLTGDARVQYQTVRLLIEQAEAAIEAKNFMYAMRLADKAEKLARQLAGQG
jgi:hypothetical protein